MKEIGCPKPCKKVSDEPEVGEKQEGKKKENVVQGKKDEPVTVPKAKKAASKDSSSACSGQSCYKAGDFNEKFKEFVKKKKVEGLNHKDAIAAWHVSKVKKRLLEHMPYSEKKKRRFV